MKGWYGWGEVRCMDELLGLDMLWRDMGWVGVDCCVEWKVIIQLGSGRKVVLRQGVWSMTPIKV